MAGADEVARAAGARVALARRGARALHPDGAAFAARLVVPGGRCSGVQLLDAPGEHRAVVRLSRALGAPRPWPDALGLALRVLDAHGPGRHQDVLLTTSVDLPLLHNLPLPTIGGFFGQSYTSALPYRVAGRRRLLGARPVRRRRGADLPEARAAAAAGDARFALCVAPLHGRWRDVAEIVLGAPLADAEAERMSFDPGVTGGGLAPVRTLLRARRAAYAGSRAQRGGAPLPDSSP